MKATRAGGVAGGALAGQHPEVAIGLVHAAGLSLSDDFVDLATSHWTATTIGGSAPTHALVAPTAYTEHGIARITTAAASGTGGVLLRSSVADLYRIPPPGSTWACKVRTSASASYDFWSGFASAAASVREGDATQFVGVRTDRAVGGNLYGVVKDGAAAANENVVDLGVSAESSTWRAVGFDVGGTVAAPSVQFYVYSLISRGTFSRTAVGSPITTNIPSTNLFSCALGVVSRAVAAKAVDVDFWTLGGRVARM